MRDETKPPSRPWIISLAYWNDVAKDVVKAACVAFSFYLGGVMVGIFKLHIRIVFGVGVVLATVLLLAIQSVINDQPKSHHHLSNVLNIATSAMGSLFLIAVIPSQILFDPNNQWAVLGVIVGFAIVIWLGNLMTKRLLKKYK